MKLKACAGLIQLTNYVNSSSSSITDHMISNSTPLFWAFVGVPLSADPVKLSVNGNYFHEKLLNLGLVAI